MAPRPTRAAGQTDLDRIAASNGTRIIRSTGSVIETDMKRTYLAKELLHFEYKYYFTCYQIYLTLCLALQIGL